jgi:hypothetical protein
MKRSPPTQTMEPPAPVINPDEKRSIRARRMIAEVETALQTQNEAQVAAQFPEWQKEFPKLFEMVLRRNYSREILNVMMEQFEKVERGATSQHNASVAVGTVLVDRIVKPQLAAAGKSTESRPVKSNS